MDDISEETFEEIKRLISSRKITICETCDNIFSYVPQKEFCDDCMREKRTALSRKCYEENREKIRARVRKWREENPEKELARHRKWREKNREKINAQRRARYHANKEK